MSDQKIALLGLGNLGICLAQRLLANEISFEAWNRSLERCVPLADMGVQPRLSINDIINECQVILSALPTPLAVQDTLLDADWAHDVEGRVVVHFGSLNPSRSQAFMDAFLAHGANYVEVAIIGGIHELAAGHAILLVGAAPAHYEQLKPLLHSLCANVQYAGPVGHAVTLKLAYQNLYAAMLSGFATSLGVIRENLKDCEHFMDLLRASPLYAPFFDQKLSRLLNRDYEQAAQESRHLLSDLSLLLEETRDGNLYPHCVQSLHEALSFCQLKGSGEADASAIYDILHPPRQSGDEADELPDYDQLKCMQDDNLDDQ